jgi:outer membrane protein, adhesin transport system
MGPAASRRLAIAVAIAFASSLPVAAASLEDTVRQTLATNPDVQFSINERRSRDAEVRQAWAGFLPAVDVVAGLGRESTNSPLTRGAGEDWPSLTRREAGVVGRQMIFDGMATRHEVARQRARVDAAAYTVFGTAEVVALRAAEVYLDVLRRQELLALAEENLGTHERIHDQIRLRSETGVGRRADLEQAEGRLALARANVIAEETNLEDAQTNFLRVVGELPGDLERPAVPAAIPSSLTELVDLALARHPVLRSAEADVEQAAAQRRAARSPFYPRFDIELARNWGRDLDGLRGVNEDWSAVLRMRYNLVRGGADLARRAQTVHQVSQAQDVRDRTSRQVIESVRLSWTAHSAIARQIEYLRRHMEAAAATRTAYAQQFNIGQRSLLDVLDSEAEWFEASRAHTNAAYDGLFAQYRILAGMGALLENLGVELPAEAVAASSVHAWE